MSNVVVPFAPPASRRNSPAPPRTDWMAALHGYQRIIREWAGHLDMHEFVLAMMLADRFLGWGKPKTSISISTDRMLNGDKMYGPLNMSRRSLFNALAGLETKGIISRKTDKRGFRTITFDQFWSPDAMVNIPKRLQGGASPAPAECTPCTGPVHLVHSVEGYQGKGNGEKGNSIVSASPRPVSATIDDIRARVSAASAASRSARAVKAQTLPDKVAGVEAAFRAALEEAHPQAIAAAWSIREKAQVKAKIKTWIAKDGSMPEFIDWAVRNWAGIIQKQFGWMTRSPAPKVPEIGFLLSFMGGFIECRSEGKLDAWLAAPERTEYEKLTARGASPEEAAAEIGKNRAVAGMREENERVRVEARARVRRAEIIERRTEATANLPAHPDSPAARRARAAEAPAPVKSSDADIANIDWGNQPTFDPNWEPPQ